MLNISLKFYNLICKNMEVYVKYHTNSFEHVKLSPVNRKKTELVIYYCLKILLSMDWKDSTGVRILLCTQLTTA